MMGERTIMQEPLFYGFNLERHVPDDHLLRSIGSSISAASERSFVPITAIRGGRRLSPSCDPKRQRTGADLLQQSGLRVLSRLAGGALRGCRRGGLGLG